MRNRTLHLYLSTKTWLAVAGDAVLAPLAGVHDDPHLGAETEGAQALARALRQQFPGTRKATLVLSARLCRFVVLPWLSGGAGAGSIRARVDAAFAADGVDPATHHVEISWPEHGAPVLAVAYPRAPVEACAQALAEVGIVLQRACASLVPVLARYGDALGPGPRLLAYAEDDGITAVTVEGGQVVQVETLSGTEGGLDDVGVWASRKRFAFADDDALRWLPTASTASPFGGEPMELAGVAAPVSAGHAVLAAWA